MSSDPPRKPPTPQERIADALEVLARDVRRRERRVREESWAERALQRITRADQQQPRRLNIADFARAIPGYMDLWLTKIPPEFWSLDGDEVTVACPCGGSPVAKLGEPTLCKGWGCPRAYVFDGQHVRVAFSPKRVNRVSDVPVA